MSVNDITSQPTLFTSASLQYARVDNENNIMQIYTTLESAKYMVELSGGYVLEVFTVRNKVLSIGDIL